MKKIRRHVRTISLVLCLVLIMSAFHALLPSASAAGAEALAAQLNAISGLSAQRVANVVNVSGSASGISSTINLNIDSNVTINWGANLTGSTASGRYLLNLSGGGTFVLLDGAKIENSSGIITATGAGTRVLIESGSLVTPPTGNGVSINVAADSITVTVPLGGMVINEGSNSAINVASGISDVKINVTGGTVSSFPNGYAINDSGGVGTGPHPANTEVTVSAGLVESGGACAIRSSGSDSVVKISGGVVRNSATNNANSTIYLNGGTGDNLIVTGGEIYTTNTSSTSYVLQTTGNVKISAGTVASINGRAINLVGQTSVATISGGIIETMNGTAVCTATTDPTTVTDAKIIIESSAVVRATGTGTAVRITGANSTAEIRGNALVTAKQGFAVDASGSPLPDSVTVSGGFVFAWGNATSRVVSPATKLSSAVGGIIAAWNTETDVGGTYNQSSTTDLSILPAASSSVFWDNEPVNSTNGGIRFSGTGFFPLDVMVIRDLFTLTVYYHSDRPPSIANHKSGEVIDVAAIENPMINFSSPLYNYPINGNVFASWSSLDGGSFANNLSSVTSFTMPGNDVTITANFKPRYFFQIQGGTIASESVSYFGSTSYGYYPEGYKIHIHGNSTNYNWNGTSEWNECAFVFVDNHLSQDAVFTMPAGTSNVGARPTTGSSGSFYTLAKYHATIVGGIITSTTAGIPPSAPPS